MRTIPSSPSFCAGPVPGVAPPAFNSRRANGWNAPSGPRSSTRFALRKFWAPVGSSIQPKPETAFVLDYLMGGPEGEKHITRLDRKVDTLPGQAGLDLVSTAVAEFGVGPKAGMPRPVRPGLTARHALPHVRRAVATVKTAVR